MGIILLSSGECWGAKQPVRDCTASHPQPYIDSPGHAACGAQNLPPLISKSFGSSAKSQPPFSPDQYTKSSFPRLVQKREKLL